MKDARPVWGEGWGKPRREICVWRPCLYSTRPHAFTRYMAVTRAMIQAGKLLDCEILDHLVIGQGGRWVSMKERGLAFT